MQYAIWNIKYAKCNMQYGNGLLATWNFQTPAFCESRYCFDNSADFLKISYRGFHVHFIFHIAIVLTFWEVRGFHVHFILHITYHMHISYYISHITCTFVLPYYVFHFIFCQWRGILRYVTYCHITSLLYVA